MGKRVIKIMRDDVYAIWRHERRFADMSREGLHLLEWEGKKLRFEKGPPAGKLYKIEVVEPGSLEVILEVYRDAGWRRITHYKELHVFSAPEGWSPPLVQRAAEGRDLLLRAIDRRLFWRLLAWIAVGLWGLFFLTAIHWRYEGFTSGIAEDQLVIQGGMVAAFACFILTEGGSYRSFRMLKRQLCSDEPLPFRPGWRWVQTVSNLMTGLLVLVWLGCVVSPVIRGELREMHTLKATDNALPLVRLADIEQNPQLVRKEGLRVDHVDWDNRVVSHWSLLAPVQYTLIELGSVPGEKWSGGGPYVVQRNREISIHGEIQDGGSGSQDSVYDYQPFLNMDYYKVAFPFMAGALVQDLIHTYSKETKPVIRQEPGVDTLYVSEGEKTKVLFAVNGSRVAYLRYTGKQPAAQLIPLLVEKLNE